MSRLFDKKIDVSGGKWAVAVAVHRSGRELRISQEVDEEIVLFAKSDVLTLAAVLEDAAQKMRD